MKFGSSGFITKKGPDWKNTELSSYIRCLDYSELTQELKRSKSFLRKLSAKVDEVREQTQEELKSGRGWRDIQPVWTLQRGVNVGPMEG